MSKSIKSLHRRVTIKDIAAMAQVSIGTVDRVLHKRGEVNQDTHDRVMAYVKELGYTPNLLAKSLALKKNFSIAALLPDAGENSPYWRKPLEGIEKATHELMDYNTVIQVYHFDPGQETSFSHRMDEILKNKPDGIIMAPNFHELAMQLMPSCKALHIPVILIDNNLEDGSELAYFGQDALQSGVAAARLMHYGLPARSEVLIVNLARNKAITRHMLRRETGFRNFFERISRQRQLTIRTISIDLSDENEPTATLGKIMEKTTHLAGIFVTNSRVHKVAQYLKDSGKGKLMLIGYDLIEANMTYLENGIIDFLICQKPEDQGYKAVMAMFNYLLTGKKADRVNYSPIDIIMKENIDYYKKINIA